MSVQQPEPLPEVKESAGKRSEVEARIQDYFGGDVFTVAPEVTETIMVEGLPNDCSEREVAHIFRPFPGYRCVKLKQSLKNPESASNSTQLTYLVEFETAQQAAVVINTIQVSQQKPLPVLSIDLKSDHCSLFFPS